jgi:ABC-type transport system, involved in lipoprotein release, permease component
MTLPLPLYIGLRYTGARRRSQLVSFLSAISITGLVVGVALLVVVLSVMNGFDRELRERILGLVPQASIKHYQGVDNWPELVATLKQDARILEAAPFVQLPGLVSFRKKAEPIVLYGIDQSTSKKCPLFHSMCNSKRLSVL